MLVSYKRKFEASLVAACHVDPGIAFLVSNVSAKQSVVSIRVHEPATMTA